MEWPKITLFGDSITRRAFDPKGGCWASLITHKVNHYFEVHSRGLEGYNTAMALEVLPRLFSKFYLNNVELFVIFFGHSDSFSPPFPSALSPKEFGANVRAIISFLLGEGLERRKIILITPSWYHEKLTQELLQRIDVPQTKKSFERVKEFSETILQIGASENLAVVDFFSASSKYEPLEELFSDGVHLSQVGAELLFDMLMPIIERKIESSFLRQGLPLKDLWHVVPWPEHRKLKPFLDAYREQIRRSSLS